MNRRRFLLNLAGGAAAAQRVPARPNVVLILADDLGWGDLSINGCADIRTPHIDGIATKGVRFLQSYSNAPECSPTRCGLLTGRYQHRVGGLECAIGVNNIGRYDEAAWLQKRGELGLPSTEATMSSILKASGYDTACFGKWHLGYLERFQPSRHGFDEFLGILGGGADYFLHDEQNEGKGQKQMFHNGERVDRKGYTTDLFADAAIEWLQRPRQRPFFLYLPFNAPHTPIQAREDYDPQTGTAPHRQGDRRTFGKMVEWMDRRIGDVLSQLDRMRASENTIVIFASDNGADPNGRNTPFRGLKSSLWEGGIRAPLHIRWPQRLRPGRETTQVALTMDILPTLLGAIGARQPSGVTFDGRNLMKIMDGSGQPFERTLYWRYRRGNVTRRAVRHGNWKYVADTDETALHDLAADPKETSNLLARNPRIAEDLRRRLARWEEEVLSPRLRDFPRQPAPIA